MSLEIQNSPHVASRLARIFSAFPPLLAFSRIGSLFTLSRDREAPVRPICVHLVGRTVVDLKGLERTSLSFILAASRRAALTYHSTFPPQSPHSETPRV